MEGSVVVSPTWLAAEFAAGSSDIVVLDCFADAADVPGTPSQGCIPGKFIFPNSYQKLSMLCSKTFFKQTITLQLFAVPGTVQLPDYLVLLCAVCGVVWYLCTSLSLINVKIIPLHV